MLIELGPLAAENVQHWARFARRVICEFRVDPDDLAGIVSSDLLDQWQSLIDRWDFAAGNGASEFRWSDDIDPEMAEFLLHGLDRCLNSHAVIEVSTAKERCRHASFTFHVVQSFVDGLTGEGRCQQHYVDQVRVSMGQQLDH